MSRGARDGNDLAEPSTPNRVKRTMLTDRTTRIRSVATLLLALTLGVGACGESLTAVNDNPNEPTAVPGAVILPNAIVDLANNMTNSFWHLSLFSTWSQQLSKIQYPDEDLYAIRADALQPFWDGWYNTGRDFQEVLLAGRETGNPNAEAIGRIMKSYTFRLITDAWGPAPYTEAFQLEEGNTTPAYDSQQAIYNGMLESLAAAEGMIEPGSAQYAITPSYDLIYAGDMESWKRFANSLRLMLAVRMSDVDAGTAAPAAQAAVSAGTFESNADNAALTFLGSAPNRNPIYVNGLGRDDQRPSETMLSVMRDFQDPRLPVYARPASNASPDDPLEVRYQGAYPSRVQQPLEWADIARIGGLWRDNPDTPYIFLSYAQVLFYKAEAALDGMIAGSAQDFYEQGIQAAMEMYGIDPGEVDAYMARDGVAWGTGGMEPIQQIGIQKWLATYMGDALDTYSEIRRLGYPDIQPGADAFDVNAGHVPARILYPPQEQSLNGSSYQAGVSMLGGDDMGTELWWDPSGDAP